MRIMVFSERLRAPYDEGIKNIAVHLGLALAAEHEVFILTSGGADDVTLRSVPGAEQWGLRNVPFGGHGIQNVDANRLLLSARLGGVIQRFQPQAMVYVPTACATLFSFIRARVLRYYGQGARMALIALQPRHYTAWGKWCIRRFLSKVPDLVLVQSRRTTGVLEELGCRTALLPPAVDAQRFRPASAAEKAALRAQYGVPGAATVVTHVGHLKGKRNLSHLLAFQTAGGWHTIVVGSTSTEQDKALKEALRAAGATVMDAYVASIEDIYRLSDVYCFLAEEDTAAIELPLSVLEAMACNLPVICTPFGGLPDFFPEGHGLYYWLPSVPEAERRGLPGLPPQAGHGQQEQGLVEIVRVALSTPCATRSLVESRTWPAAAQSLMRLLSTDTRPVSGRTRRSGAAEQDASRPL